jgi:hypothetical protein
LRDGQVRPDPQTVFPRVTYGRDVSEMARLRGTRGLFFLSDHPWVAVVVIALIIGLVYYQSHHRR